jgi:xanthine dehydrogenase/oxidase
VFIEGGHGISLANACSLYLFSTPGFVMSMYGLLINNPKPTTAEIEDRFDGNLCRCTGYRPIFKAMRTLVPPSGEQKNAAGGCACGSGGKCGCSSHAAPTKSTCDSGSSSSTSAMKACGKGEGLDCSSGAKSACNSQGITCGSASSKGCGTVDMEDLLYDASNPRHNVNPFPHALVEYNHTESLKSSVEKGVRYVADSQAIWFQPQDLSDVYAILAQYQATEVVKLVVGNSSIGVTKYYTQNPLTDQPTIFINTAGLSELTSTQLVANQGLLLGASVTLTTLISLLDQTISSAPLVTTSWVALSRHIKMVANTGVRNVASWTGNMMIAKSHSEFPSDLMTIFAAHGATITVSSSSGTPKTMSVLQFDSYTMLPGEIVISLLIPFTPANWQFDSYKVRARHQNAHPIINAGYGFTVVKGQTTISAVQMVIGGLTETGIFQPQQTMAYLTGKSLSAATLAGALAVLDKEAVPGDRPDPNSTFYISSPVYRHSLVLSTFYKFFLSQMSAAGVAVPDGDTSAFEVFNRGVSSGAEVYNTGADPLAPVGRAIPKLESAGQVSGGAKYIDDMQLPPNGLWASYVYSKVAVGTIESFDPTAALAMPGVFQFISAADLVGKFANDCGSFPGDEEIFCSGSVTASGQALGLILADTRAHADAAAAAVVVNWKTLTPAPVPIVSIQDALSAVPPSVFPDNKYMQNPPDITSGDFETAFKNSPHQVSGTNSSAGQTHFFVSTEKLEISTNFLLSASLLICA